MSLPTDRNNIPKGTLDICINMETLSSSSDHGDIDTADHPIGIFAIVSILYRLWILSKQTLILMKYVTS